MKATCSFSTCDLLNCPTHTLRTFSTNFLHIQTHISTHVPAHLWMAACNVEMKNSCRRWANNDEPFAIFGLQFRPPRTFNSAPSYDCCCCCCSSLSQIQFEVLWVDTLCLDYGTRCTLVLLLALKRTITNVPLYGIYENVVCHNSKFSSIHTYEYVLKMKAQILTKDLRVRFRWKLLKIVQK